MRFIKVKYSEAFYLKVLCFGLKIGAWFLLFCGIFAAVALSGLFPQLLLLSQWSGVAVLAFFITVFLFINLIVHIAWMIFDIKKKVFSDNKEVQ